MCWEPAPGGLLDVSRAEIAPFIIGSEDRRLHSSSKELYSAVLWEQNNMPSCRLGEGQAGVSGRGLQKDMK